MTVHALSLLINIGIALPAGRAALRKSKIPGAISLTVLSTFAAIWSACYLLYEAPAVSSLRPLLVAAIFFSSGIAALAQLVYSLARTNRRPWISRFTLALLGLVPVVTQVLYWVQPWRTIFFESPGTSAENSILLAGSWARVNFLYVYALAGTSLVLSLEAFVRRPRLMLPARPGIVLLGSLLPPLVLTLDLAFSGPLSRIELLPAAFTLAALGYAYEFFNQQSRRITSIDRNAVVEGMDDGWMVVDTHNLILDMNSAAERMTGLAREKVFGQPIASVLGDLPNLGQTFKDSQELEMKRSIRSEEGWRYLNIRISSLTDPDHKPFGRLAVWRDMTERKLTEDARQRGRDEMFVLLNAISSAASNTFKLEDFLLECIYHIIYPFRSQVVGFFLMDERNKKSQDQRLFLASHLGIPAKSVDDLANLSVSSPLMEWVMKNRQPLQIENASDDLRVPLALRKIGIACLLTIPLLTQAREEARVLGFMCMARKANPAFSQDEIVRLTTLSDQIANLIDSDRRRKLAIVSSERQRLMRDLHDSVSQKLYGLVTTTEAAQAALEAGNAVDPSQILSRIGENARQAVKEMRLFLYQMQQIDVEKDGLISVLHHRLAAVEGRADIKARLLTADEEISLSKDKEIALYYIAQEALNNVLRHAHAKSVSVTLKQGRQNVILEILDDGCGFDLKKVDRAGLGLQNMRERTAQINGKLKIVSKPDEGTRIMITVRKDPPVKPLKRRRSS